MRSRQRLGEGSSFTINSYQHTRLLFSCRQIQAVLVTLARSSSQASNEHVCKGHKFASSYCSASITDMMGTATLQLMCKVGGEW